MRDPSTKGPNCDSCFSNACRRCSNRLSTCFFDFIVTSIYTGYYKATKKAPRNIFFLLRRENSAFLASPRSFQPPFQSEEFVMWKGRTIGYRFIVKIVKIPVCFRDATVYYPASFGH